MGKGGCETTGRRRKVEIGAGGDPDGGEGGCGVVAKGVSEQKRGERPGRAVRWAGQGSLPGAGDARVSHGAPVPLDGT